MRVRDWPFKNNKKTKLFDNGQFVVASGIDDISENEIYAMCWKKINTSKNDLAAKIGTPSKSCTCYENPSRLWVKFPSNKFAEDFLKLLENDDNWEDIKNILIDKYKSVKQDDDEHELFLENKFVKIFDLNHFVVAFGKNSFAEKEDFIIAVRWDLDTRGLYDTTVGYPNKLCDKCKTKNIKMWIKIPDNAVYGFLKLLYKDPNTENFLKDNKEFIRELEK
ncbi:MULTISPECIES: hypothetical protein [unclassified Campylobacter]|uniref:hypothetical protein n=1 Tax=unclassified Campylobacter TaxID=2593542 RepID=UPI0022E9CDF9|nr:MULTISPECIES: hypothetical protein [unclassified Campylobacter]MDA3042888.1 hypothetical protein [Campylobacter sp. JMF_09 ED2]MDA3044277.1 hypothetical protein [Campylobacter sp. JMF_07 ED4]MDA3063626.1 hypothetical protein [Campylobacter sp. JMF_11 EL3]MDA3071252.1 hypothetical protein [Campylobacter sp. VBCF_03 NA9]MDA3074712.1 hypothetical protein [Campylobacter sp. JMF_05 ED3]